MLQLTNAGKLIIAKGLLGKTIHFTKAQYGSGDFDYSKESVATLTALKAPKLDLPVTGKNLSNGLAIIKANFDNYQLAQGFPAKEIGIFAQDPDTGAEVLYAYNNVGMDYTFIPPSSGTTVKKNVTLSYVIEIQDAQNVTFTIDWNFAYVSHKEFEDHLNDELPHEKVVQKLLDTRDFVIANAEIGLQGNFLLLENFKTVSQFDMTQKKVLNISGTFLNLSDIANISVGEYFLSDGVNCQSVKVVSKSATGATLEAAPTLNFNLQNTYLCKSILPPNLTQDTTFANLNTFTLISNEIDAGEDLAAFYALVKHNKNANIKMYLHISENPAEEKWQDMTFDYSEYDENFDQNLYASRFYLTLDTIANSRYCKYKIVIPKNAELVNVAFAASFD